MQLTGRMWLGTAALGMVALSLSAVACGDSSSSDDDTSTPGCDPTISECGPTFASDDASTICEAACARYAVCTDVEPTAANLASCVKDCTPKLVKSSRANTCPYTSANIDTCAGAYDDFSCASTLAGSSPVACSWTCDLSASDAGK